nr:MAG TPA: hypothetical protein [Caudoviricetes sp.]DAL04588.1 MAG TPA: hypothetical protein [Caudoviricetes sp.]
MTNIVLPFNKTMLNLSYLSNLLVKSMQPLLTVLKFKNLAHGQHDQKS